ncbi:MAG: protein kinase [Solirubrobacteraceae bacterium]
MSSAQLQSDLPARYRVLRHVATGGMAAVYAAADELLHREVAIKVLSPALAVDDASRERFTREARAAARVGDHPNVVTIYDIGETAGDPPGAFIVMELLTGGTIAERLKAGEPIPHTLALRWLDQTASALDAAHAEGMVHRDVKPANLLLDAQGTLKVADFGIATLATDSPLTQTGQVVGTAAYFAPEQALGKPATAASDRYALAVLAYELLTGSRPFPPGPPAAQALARVESEPPRATTAAPGLPNAVDPVLCAGMARDPEQRPRSSAELVARLEEALGATAATGVAHPVTAPTEKLAERTPRPRRSVAAATPPPRTRPAVIAASPPASPRPASTDGPTSERPSRRGPLAALAALLLVAGAGLAIALGDNGDELDRFAERPTTTAAKEPARGKTTEEPTTTAASSTPAPAGTPAGRAPADAAGIQASAHNLLAAGDYAGAVAELSGLVNRCDVQITDPCAYAWFDYGSALRRAGDPAAAVEALEVRLQNPNQQTTVQEELNAALADLEGSNADGDESSGQGPGKAKGKGKGKD